MTIKNRLDAAEKYLRKHTPGVGVLMPVNGAWHLFFDGQETDFPTEGEAKAAFRRLAGPDATLIIW